MNPVFHAFNPQASIEVYHRNLPHWRQANCTYFVTFRLTDSIPRNVLIRWRHERKTWLEGNGVLALMSQSERSEAYLRINAARRSNFERDHSRRLFAELDQCHGCCIFKTAESRIILKDSMLYFNGERYWSGDFVIMPNHVHWIVQPLEPHSLESTLQSIKRFVSTQLTKLELRNTGRLWQSESHDHIIRNRMELSRIREYIQANPLKARLPDDHYSIFTADWLDD